MPIARLAALRIAKRLSPCISLHGAAARERQQNAALAATESTIATVRLCSRAESVRTGERPQRPPAEAVDMDPDRLTVCTGYGPLPVYAAHLVASKASAMGP